jgi:hypothetical protein
MEINNNITKYTDLSNDDSLSSFKGHTAQQFHGAYEVFYEFIKEVKPSRILEIGTALGGFTNFLKIVCDELNLNTNIRSYDIHKHPWYDGMVDSGIDVRVENIFTEKFLDMDQEVKDYINQEGITIVLCDGGWKIGEFNLISKYIKPGDFILAHDYAENREVFDEKIYGKIWNWFEISDSDIHQSTVDNNLEIYKKDTFEGVAWTCRKKI